MEKNTHYFKLKNKWEEPSWTYEIVHYSHATIKYTCICIYLHIFYLAFADLQVIHTTHIYIYQWRSRKNFYHMKWIYSFRLFSLLFRRQFICDNWRMIVQMINSYAQFFFCHNDIYFFDKCLIFCLTVLFSSVFFLLKCLPPKRKLPY